MSISKSDVNSSNMNSAGKTTLPTSSDTFASVANTLVLHPKMHKNQRVCPLDLSITYFVGKCKPDIFTKPQFIGFCKGPS